MYQILIVDDSVFDIDCITFLIKKYDLPLQVTTSVDGQDALNRFREEGSHFDILFTDIRMPFLDGLALSKEVRTLSPRTKIIIFSGYNDFEYAKTAITIGVEDYIMKPVVPDEFLAVMTRVINAVEESNRQTQARCHEMKLLKSHLLWLAVNGNSTPLSNSVLFADCHYRGLLMMEFDDEFFSLEDLSFQERLEALLSTPFDYLNLDPGRSLLFFKEETFLFAAAQAVCLCAETDFQQRCCVTFQTLSDNHSISQVYAQLEKRLESRFFFPEQNIFRPDGPDHPYGGSGHISVDIVAANQLLNLSQKEQAGRLKSDKIKQYVCQNYAKPLSLNDIAGHFYISPNYLCSIFKKETGCNLMKFINEYRLNQAAKLLAETEMKVGRIAETVGFPNPSYFSQRFRDYFGMSPEHYRQKEIGR